MIVLPSPQFVQLTSEAVGVTELMEERGHVSSKRLESALLPLKPTGQAKEGEMNFFVLGLRVAMVFYVLPVAITTLGGLAFGARKVYYRS